MADNGTANRINVLMCGGKRTGKTSIMSAIQQNMQDLFPKGDILLNMDYSGKLALYQVYQKSLFDDGNYGNMYYHSDDLESSEQEIYTCQIRLQDRESKFPLEFIDIPGEWFVQKEEESRVLNLMKKSQILVITVDSPHLLEDNGRYHDVFNRPDQITDKIKRAFQADNEIRMILFVPLKCERYKNERIPGMNMEFLLERLKEGYKDLLDYVGSNAQKKRCAVAVAPCITMGGMEFVQFCAPRDDSGKLITDELGKPLKDMILNPQTGYYDMTFVSRYIYLMNADGDRLYKPQDCEQPLLYILLFLIGYGKMSNDNVNLLGWLFNIIKQVPNNNILEACRQLLKAKLKKNPKDGFAVLNDPMKMF